jgi:hypothetical protein
MHSPLRRIRGVIGTRLRLLQARDDASARALELLPSIDELRTELARLHDLQNEHGLELRAELARLHDLQNEHGLELRTELARLHDLQEEQGLQLRTALDHAVELRSAIAELHDRQVKHVRLSQAHYDDIGRLREKLIALRRSTSYGATFENRRPLISVPIATYNAAELLVDRAIASVLAQTYDGWEIVVVGDGCTDDTEARVKAIGDARISFVNLPFRTVYPDDANDRWLVSGAAPWNRAVELCQGEWIAPLDDDDEFLPHHMETLLSLALERQAEYAYGKLVQPSGAENFSFPPEHAQVGMQAAIYLRGLAFFECDTYSWAREEPTDWNVIRRMRDAGVRMAATEEVVARYYPSMQAWRL